MVFCKSCKINKANENFGIGDEYCNICYKKRFSKNDIEENEDKLHHRFFDLWYTILHTYGATLILDNEKFICALDEEISKLISLKNSLYIGE